MLFPVLFFIYFGEEPWYHQKFDIYILVNINGRTYIEFRKNSFVIVVNKLLDSSNHKSSVKKIWKCCSWKFLMFDYFFYNMIIFIRVQMNSETITCDLEGLNFHLNMNKQTNVVVSWSLQDLNANHISSKMNKISWSTTWEIVACVICHWKMLKTFEVSTNTW